MDIWESILLCLWWVVYIFMVYRTDLLADRCCCCVSEKELDKVRSKADLEMKSIDPLDKETAGNGGTNYVALGGTEEDNDDTHHRPSYQRSKSVVQRGDTGVMGVIYDDKGHPVADMDQNPDNIRIGGGIQQDGMDEELQNLLDELNRKQRQNVNKGWVVVVMPQHEAKSKGFVSSGNDGVDRADDVVGLNQGRGAVMSSHAYVRRRTLMETLEHEKQVQEEEEAKNQYHGVGDYDEDEHHHSRGSAILHKVLSPWTWLFGKTLPKVEGEFTANHIFITIFMIVCWLGILTFFVGM